MRKVKPCLASVDVYSDGVVRLSVGSGYVAQQGREWLVAERVPHMTLGWPET